MTTMRYLTYMRDTYHSNSKRWIRVQHQILLIIHVQKMDYNQHHTRLHITSLLWCKNTCKLDSFLNASSISFTICQCLFTISWQNNCQTWRTSAPSPLHTSKQALPDTSMSASVTKYKNLRAQTLIISCEKNENKYKKKTHRFSVPDMNEVQELAMNNESQIHNYE